MWVSERKPRRIFALSAPVDMRKSFDGLIAVTRSVLQEDPLSGDLFVFINRRGTHIKALFWDRTGFVLIAKRLERGRFTLAGSGTKRAYTEQLFSLLWDGIPVGIPER